MLQLDAQAAEIYGDEIRFERPFGNIGYWHGEGDYVVWQVAVEQSTTYEVQLEWSCAEASAGNLFCLEGGAPKLTAEVASTGGWDQYRTTSLGRVTLAAGSRSIVVRPAAAPRGALFDLRGLRLTPVRQP